MFILWIAAIVAFAFILFYLKLKIEEKLTIIEIRKMELDEKQCRSKMKIVADRIVEYTLRIGDLLFFPLVTIFRYPVLQAYEQQKEIDHWLKIKIVIGGMVMYIVAIGNTLISLFFFVMSIAYRQIFGAVLLILVQSALSIALIRGRNWARIFFGVFITGCGVVFLGGTIADLQYTGGASFRQWAIVVAVLLVGLFLLYSRSVKYFVFYKSEC